MAPVTANSCLLQETMLKPAVLQVLIKFAANESGRVFALAGPELGPVDAVS